MRIESDFIGEMNIPDDALYGIHSLRAKINFPDSTPFPVEWYKAVGTVKQACYLTFIKFQKAALEKYSDEQVVVKLIPDVILQSMIQTAEEISKGVYWDQFIVPAISGGAGTSINMNINEIIANASLTRMNRHPGDYAGIDPIEHANIFQSTNDVIPTSLKVALMFLLNELENAVNELRFVVEQLENEHRNDLRVGYTQMQEAVPTSWGKLFSTYSDALSRDWWRVSKCFERIKMVNLGGGATGTGMAIPRFFIMEAIGELQKLTGLPVTRSENLPDATSNLDSFVEVHATLKANAVNLEKMVSDIRLLSSDLVSGPSQLSIPAKQAGSSIMPGKINPVIPEFVISAVHRIYSNDQLVSALCGQGCLELNAYLPAIGFAMIESIRLLIASCRTMKDNLFQGLIVNSSLSEEMLYRSPVITTALLPFIGYNKASELARLMKSKEISIHDANRELGMIDQQKLLEILKPENLLKLGYSLNEIIE